MTDRKEYVVKDDNGFDRTYLLTEKAAAAIDGAKAVPAKSNKATAPASNKQATPNTK